MMPTPPRTGEFWAGAGKNVDASSSSTLGTGVGGGIIIGESGARRPAQPWRAKLAGTMKIEMTKPRQCGCGHFGCLESVCQPRLPW